jgi:glucoamylase
LADFLNIKAWFAALAVFIGGAILVSGGTTADPPVPRGFPGVVPAFLAGTTGSDRRGEKGGAIRRDRRWLTPSTPLGDEAPRWATRMYRRSLLVLRALADPRTGAVAAGPREGWAFVWPRDAAAVAIALSRSGYGREARQVVRFLAELDLGSAARFRGNGEPVPGRSAQGDAAGWVAAAARAANLPTSRAQSPATTGALGSIWRGRADYLEKEAGDYLGNAIAAGLGGRRIGELFGSGGALVRVAGDPRSGLDSAAAWAVRPFPQPALFPAVRRTLLRLIHASGRFGLLPSEDWDGGDDPWTAPTAWSAWALAALWRSDLRRRSPHTAAADRDAALRLMADLRRAATPLGLLPERVDARTGLPASTTPLAWSHAFTILALRELWPGRR